MEPSKKIVLSCEHAGNIVPESYKYLFVGAEEVLNSHRGYDIGAIDLFKAFKQLDVAYARANTVSRLLVDVNRSLYRQTLFSEYTRNLNQTQKQDILKQYYFSYRELFKEVISKIWLKNEQVLHLSIHSFTPILNNEVRNCDIGLLYHPQRKYEKEFCRRWRSEITKYLPQLRVRFNYPYSGKPDGHVRYYRDMEVQKYMGIELELNQKHARNKDVINGIIAAFHQAILN